MRRNDTRASKKLQVEVERLVYSADETGYNHLPPSSARRARPGDCDRLSAWHPARRETQPGRPLAQLPQVRPAVPGVPLHLPSPSYRKRYLSSNLVKGIGPVMAGCLLDRFGDDTLEVKEKYSQRLTEVPGIGPRRVKSISWSPGSLRSSRVWA